MLEQQIEHGMILIGVSGKAHHGKDSLAECLVQDHGFMRYAFGDGVKEALYALNPAVGINRATGKVTYLKPLWDAQTGSFTEKWDKIKNFAEIRRLLQRMGTEAGREIHGPDVWVDASFRKMDTDWASTTQVPERPARYVISDVRFPNEADRIREAGGYMVRITRPDIEPLRDEKGHIHVSETALDDYPHFAYFITNDQDLQKLSKYATMLASDLQPTNW